MWPSCNYSLPVQHSQGARRADICGETPVHYDKSPSGDEKSSLPACTKTSSNMCLHMSSPLLLWDIWGDFFVRKSSESTCGALTRAQTFSFFHFAITTHTTHPDRRTRLWQLIWTLLLPVSLTQSVGLQRGKRNPITDKTDSYHTGWCAVMVSEIFRVTSTELMAVCQRRDLAFSL